MTPSESSRSNMRALVLHAIGDLRLESMPRPTCGQGQVVVRVASCGVCGSDIPRIFSKGTYSFPLICGHEFSGTVDDVGPGVTDFEPGDRVAVFPLIWCGKCSACEQGRYVQCAQYDYLGSRCHGAFAEFVVAPRQNLVRLPKGLSLEEAAMTEPAAVSLHAIRAAGGCSVGETAVIFGAGPIGLMAAQWARAMGAGQVVIFDLVPAKLELAGQLGFVHVFNAQALDPIPTVHQLTQGEGAHLCVEAAGVSETLLQALRSARRAGRVVVLGNPSANVTVPASLISQIMRREVSLHGTWNSSYSTAGNDDDWHATIDAMASGLLDLRPLITHRVGLEESIETLGRMRDRSEFFAKVLVEPGRE